MTLADVVLLVAIVQGGLLAGAFALYSHSLMPGLRETDDVTFVGAFQAIDRAVINPWFIGGCFLGAPVMTAVAVVLHLGDPELPWLVASLALLLTVAAVTMVVNVPRNDAIKAAGDPTADTAPGIRAAFDEARWARWNLVRTLATIASLICAGVALAG